MAFAKKPPRPSKDEAPHPRTAAAPAVHAIGEGDRIAAFRRWARQGVEGGTLATDGFRRAGDATPAPPAGAERDAWVDAAITRALRLTAASTIYAYDEPLVDALTDHVETTVDLEALARQSNGFCTAFEQMAIAVASRYNWLAGDRDRTIARIETESGILRDLDVDALSRRFEFTLPARLDAPPRDDIVLRDWIDEMLRGEAISIMAGLVPPADIARIACRCHLPTVHVRPADGGRITTAFPAFHPALLRPERHRERAAGLATLSREILYARFTDVPGFDAAIDRTFGHEDVTALLERALLSEEIRKMSGLATHVGSEPEIALSDVTLLPTDGGMGFDAVLHVFGDRLCRISGDGTGDMTATEWSEGCSAVDLRALDAYVTATGEPRDDGETPDTLLLRVHDLISVNTMIHAYRLESENHVLFGIEDQGRERIHAEPVPQGASREAVIERYVASAPRAVSLDQLDELDAAELWMSLTF